MKKGLFLLLAVPFLGHTGKAQVPTETDTTGFELYGADTRALMALVDSAAELIRIKGTAAFADFRTPESRWREDETYIFVLDLKGDMLVHPDPELEGKNQWGLKDINGKPIIRGLIDAATAFSEKPGGWYHYEWPVPGGLLPRWKSSYVKLVTDPAGRYYVVGSGMYNNRMERGFVIDAVTNAVSLIEKKGTAAFPSFHDRTGPFLVKDAYIFVINPEGIDLVNPAFPSLEGRNTLDMKDTRGKQLVKEMIQVAETSGSGWVDYMWPKPGQSASTQKSTYVSKARMGADWVVVGCGVYLADAPESVETKPKMSAQQLMDLVGEGVKIFEKKGEKAFPLFREKGSKWFHDDTYFFVWTMEGERIFHAANPESEGQDMSHAKDVLGRPWGKMFLDAAASSAGEGWVHYMYPEPGDIFPTWKSSFVKRVTFPSGKQYLIGCGIYNMDMDKRFIEDVVNRAVSLVESRGKDAFAELRDKTGPFYFMDTYIFLDDLDGNELVNGGLPALEGKNLMDLKDLQGTPVVRNQINLALEKGRAWLECYWYRPGDNIPALKQTYVRKAQFGDQTFIIGSGFYVKNK